MSKGRTSRVFIRSILAALAALLILGLMVPGALGQSPKADSAGQNPGKQAFDMAAYRLTRQQWASHLPQVQAGVVRAAAAVPTITSLSPPFGSAYNLVIITGTGFGNARDAGYVSFGGVQLTDGASYDGWADTQIRCAVPLGISGTVAVTVTTAAGTSNALSFKVQYVLYFAEGFTGAGFDEYLCILNAADSGIPVGITYTFKDASKQEQRVDIAAGTRMTIYVNTVVGRDKEVSVQISSATPVFAERPMYFNYGGWTGGHDVVGAGWISDVAIFPEGYTGQGFQEFLCLLNPNTVPANVAIAYLKSGHEYGGETLVLAPQQRATVDVNFSAGRDIDVSCMVVSDQCIVAERPMYFNYGGWTGGHDVVGLPYLSGEYYFAEGCTRPGFSEYLCLMNGGTAATTAHITYMFPDGTTQNHDVNVAANSRETVNVNLDCPNRDVSVKVTADPPLAVERPMYFNYKGVWSGGHTVIGSAYTLNQWIFAEGYTGRGFEEYLCIMNPTALPVDVGIMFIFSDGTTQPDAFSIGANTRTTVYVNDVVGSNREVSSIVYTLNETDMILAERPMYFNYNGVWDGGHDVIGW